MSIDLEDDPKKPGAPGVDVPPVSARITQLRKEREKAKEEEGATGAPAKKKVTKKKAKEPEYEVDLAWLSELVGDALDMVLVRMPNPAPSTTAEKKRFTQALVKVLDKRIPAILGWQEEIALAIITGMMLSQRLKGKRNADKVEERESEIDPGGTRRDPGPDGPARAGRPTPGARGTDKKGADASAPAEDKGTDRKTGKANT